MNPSESSVSKRSTALLIVLAILVLLSIGYHNHPSMNGLQEELRSKAPVLFKLFVGGEACYFLGMILVALGVGSSLGPNPVAWPSKLKTIMSQDHSDLAQAKVFWLGFALNALGSLTFSIIGIYVAVNILPGGSWTIIPAALVDLGCAFVVRFAFFRRLRRRSKKAP